MLVGLYSSATGLEAAEKMHEIIAENLAHVSVPGYRANVMSHQTFEQAFQGELSDPSPEGHGTHFASLTTDFTHGATAATGRPLDVALGGDGFFEVQGPDGSLYTRNGVFYLDENNQLVNSEGLAVLSDAGPIQVPAGVSTDEIVISQEGSLIADGNEFGQLRRVSFDDNRRLIRAGTTTFQAPVDMPATDAETIVIQGSRELSNVSAVNELVRMIVGTRHYEAAKKAMTTMDEAISQVTNPQA